MRQISHLHESALFTIPLKRLVEGGGRGGGEWIHQKRKTSDKNLFSDNVKWSSKNLWKMIYVDVRAKIKQKEIKELVAASYKFI